MTPPKRFVFDFAVYDAQGQLVALLEAKRRFHTDIDWAKAWYEMLQDRLGRPVNTPVWMITPDRLYTWPPQADRSAAPRVLDAAPLLEPYFKRLQIPADSVDPRVFEAIVGLWLRDVAEDEPPPTHGNLDKELLDALRGSEVISEFAA